MFSSHIRKISFHLTVICLLTCLSANSQAQSPRVLVSIKPLHSLISHITDGVSQAGLLLENQQSPHHFQLRPSQKRMINQADIFFYSSNDLEGFVESLRINTKHLQFIELSSLPELNTLAARSFHSHKDHDDKHDTLKHNIDGHIWLSISNAQIIAQHVAKILSDLDSENANHYKNNLKHLLVKLETLKQNNIALLSNINKRPFLVYHDAYQYFEQENNLKGAHFVTTTPEHTPGIKRVKELKRLIKEKNIQCIFYEPPNIPSLLTTLTENTTIELRAIDPAGSQLTAGKQHYFTLMQTTASILHTCLSKH